MVDRLVLRDEAGCLLGVEPRKAVQRIMQQAARCSDYTAYMYLGELVEFGETDQIFMNPGRRETQDYITGRFG